MEHSIEPKVSSIKKADDLDWSGPVTLEWVARCNYCGSLIEGNSHWSDDDDVEWFHVPTYGWE